MGSKSVTKSKATSYKDQLLEALQRSGWELIEIREEAEWWATQHWVIASTRQAYGARLFMSFLVDPAASDVGQKDRYVYNIAALTTLPADRSIGDESCIVAELSLSKGHFGEKLSRFVQDIDDYRDKNFAT